MAAFHLRQKGRNYHVEVYDPDRRPKRRWISLRTTRRDVALQKLTKLERDAALGVWDPWADAVPEAGVTLADAVGRFLRDRGRSGKSPKTVQSYRKVLDLLARTLPPDLAVDAVTPRQVEAFVRRPGLAEASAASYHGHLRAFFRWSVAAGLVKHDPMTGLEPPKAGRKEARFLSPHELERIVAAIHADAAVKGGLVRPGEAVWLAGLVVFAVSTGMRLGEIVALRWGDVDLDHGFLTVRNRPDGRTKSGHDRRIPLVAGALLVVRDRAGAQRAAGAEDSDAYVFESPRGGRLDPGYVSKRFKRAARLAKLNEDIHFHSLRHTAASWLIVRGVPLAIVQSVLGHASITTTMRYSHLAPGAMQAEMDRALGEIARGEGRVEEPMPFYKGSTNPRLTVHDRALTCIISLN